MRFIAAPWAGLLSNDVWLENARRANASADKLARRLREVAGLTTAFPRQANALFLRLPEPLVRQLHRRGWHFYKFLEPDVYRLMCSWALDERVIDEFITDVKALQKVHA
jgi:threonine aldolase